MAIVWLSSAHSASMTKPTVHDVESAFLWPLHFAAAVGALHRNGYIKSFFEDLTFSSSFSGICAPTTGLHMLAQGLYRLLGISVRLRYLFAVEWYGESQLELQCLPTPPDHVFTNIEGFATEDSKKALGNRKEIPVAELEEIFMKNPNSVVLHAHTCCCLVANCPGCKMQRSSLHIAGTPCKDFSTQNNGRPGLGGKTTKHLFIWMALMKLLLPTIIVCENVVGFPPQLLRTFLPMYDLKTAVLNHFHFGHCIQRIRRYTTLHLRTAVTLVRELCPIKEVLGRVRSPSHVWPQYLVASDAEMRQEFRWANSRLSKRCAEPRSGALPYSDVLNHWERAHLDAARGKAPGMAMTLSQDP